MHYVSLKNQKRIVYAYVESNTYKMYFNSLQVIGPIFACSKKPAKR